MRFLVAAVGKVRDRALRAALDGYLERIRHYHPIDEVEFRDAGDAAARLARAVPERFTRVALDAGGEELSSEAFAKWVGNLALHGAPGVAFLLGGADGLPREALRGAARTLSLSRMTLPHRLARVVLAEQIYRAMTILRGEPYAR